MQILIPRRISINESALEFIVRGGITQPSELKENMFWVKTDVQINGWSFNAEEPIAPNEGMVWIVIGTNDRYIFNAIEKNTFQVYPKWAFQYISGSWVQKDTYIYQNGVWRELYYKPKRIAELNSTGWARYSEGMSGEYVRCNGRGFTRSSSLPIIWAYARSYSGGNYYGGYMMIAANSAALSYSSATSYGNCMHVTTSTPKGNTAHIYCMESMWNPLYSFTVYSGGENFTIGQTDPSQMYYYPDNTLGATLGTWVDELLFDEVDS